LAELEKRGKLAAVVTQNIDGLHYMAGSKTVYELHGSIHRNYCMDCKKSYSLDYIKSSDGIPRCSCGGIIKPDVVLYEEGLDDNVTDGALRAISEADTMLVAGTSLTVYPAAGMLRYFKGRNLVLINLAETPFDGKANLVIRDKIGNVMSCL
jgi:NAD-dependent deacetylase